MKRWNHAHSLAAGILGGVALAGHVWILVAVAFGFGVLLGRFWHLIHWTGEAIRLKVLYAKRDRELHLKTKPQPIYYGKFPEGY